MIKYGILLFVSAYFVQGASVLSGCTCTREFNPVCGSDGVTYSNPCTLRCAGSRSGKQLHSTPGRCSHISKRQTEGNDIPCACRRDYKPVCGTDGKTYSNHCTLNCARSKNPNLEMRNEGLCRNDVLIAKPCICTFIYKPVCGTDGVTYGNECALNCTKSVKLNLALKYEGECQKENLKASSCFCPFINRPVCGSDGKTYASKCTLNCERSTNLGLEVRHEGECQRSAVRSSCNCARNYSPICGNDGETYSNECTFNCAKDQTPALEFGYEGECEENAGIVKRDATPAECVCTFIYSPVCGDDGRTYSNNCLLKCHAKESGRAIEVSHAGSC